MDPVRSGGEMTSSGRVLLSSQPNAGVWTAATNRLEVAVAIRDGGSIFQAGVPGLDSSVTQRGVVT